MGQTVTKLYVGKEQVGAVTTFKGPESVDVKTFLEEKLKDELNDVAGSVEKNALFRSLLNLSLGGKDVSVSVPQREIIPVYLKALEQEICQYDLELCASLLGGDSLQLPDRSYFQVTSIKLDKK